MTKQARQDALLRAGVQRLRTQVPFYQTHLANIGEVLDIEDLSTLPFTTKADLRSQAPWGMLANRHVIRLHASSGSSGKPPTLMAYTRRDLELWASLTARALATTGVRQDTRVHCAFGYGLFTGGMGFQAGAEQLGALTVPAGGMDPTQQIQLMAQLQPEVLLATPTGAVTLLETARQMDVDPRQLGLQKGVFGGELWSDELRVLIEEGFGLEAYDTYGLSEILGPGVAHECEQHQGLHIVDDHFIPEIVNPAGEVLPMGEYGELVLTALTKEGMPLLRYRTGDLTRLDDRRCACGNGQVRMARVLERVGDPFPWMTIERTLLSLPERNPHFKIQQCHRPWLYFEQKEQRALQVEQLLASQGLVLRASIVSPGSMDRGLGKSQRLG